jgi:hypothetical protein
MRCAQYDGQNGIEREPRVGGVYIGNGFPHSLTRSGRFYTERFLSRWPRQARALIGGDISCIFSNGISPSHKTLGYLLLLGAGPFFL